MNFISFALMGGIIQSGAHLTKDGAEQLLDIYSKMNSNRSWLEKYNFMSTHTINVTFEWLQGFIDGDGSFTTWVGLSSPTRKTRHNVLQLFLEIKQNTHDVRLLQCIIDFLEIGSIKPKFDIYDPIEIQTGPRGRGLLVLSWFEKQLKLLDLLINIQWWLPND
uniref:Homing endonuclease LAGLIDADG domain-containing protein n=1 Tax=Microbotryum lychnidis-dioicae TaxID=288795 RepID=M1GMS6_9BASI|nr:hypothetical protein H911_mgp03 [Microbotryum lychnidis-dioicae]AGE14566.1 hypothetical protein [Microbotryum lychnidis-dioicae]